METAIIVVKRYINTTFTLTRPSSAQGVKTNKKCAKSFAKSVTIITTGFDQPKISLDIRRLRNDTVQRKM